MQYNITMGKQGKVDMQLGDFIEFYMHHGILAWTLQRAKMHHRGIFLGFFNM